MVENDSIIRMLTCGVASGYALESLTLLNLKASVFKGGMTFPIPEMRLKKFIQGVDRLFLVEEGDPYLELYVRAFAKDVNPNVQIFVKDNGYFPLAFGYDNSVPVKALTRVLKLNPPIDCEKKEAETEEFQKNSFFQGFRCFAPDALIGQVPTLPKERPRVRQYFSWMLGVMPSLLFRLTLHGIVHRNCLPDQLCRR